MAQLRSAWLRQKWNAAGLFEASDADRSVVISTGNSLDMRVPVASGKGGVLACICLWRGGHAGDSCDAMAVPVHWLATGDTVAERKGK